MRMALVARPLPRLRRPLSALGACLLVVAACAPVAAASRDAKRLHDDLLSDYNRLIRPVGNHSHKVTIVVGLKLSQLIDINLKHQVMTTNIWLEQEWEDYKLRWNPEEYGGVDMIHVPAESLWLPDIVLFNNADGNYEVILMNKATVYSTGKVIWKPPALYKSTCEIDVEYFPFDEQNCLMKFGSWTYDGMEVDLVHVKQKPGSTIVETGIDMSEFYKSVEWDILLVPAKYNNEFYDCCEEPFPDITFNITMRRKTLFYTVNLIIPCVGISFLTVLVFYLPSDSGEKVTLCISILVSLTVFFLLLAEIIPPTSLAVPLLGKYLLFTMILVTLSISVTVGVLNVHFRSPSTHKMAPWVRRVFIHVMPRLLLMRRPAYKTTDDEDDVPKLGNGMEFRRGDLGGIRSSDPLQLGRMRASPEVSPGAGDLLGSGGRQYTPEMQKAIESILFIAEHIRKEDEDESDGWHRKVRVLMCSLDSMGTEGEGPNRKNLKNQIMTTNVWVNQEWSDHKLKWDPQEYGGVTELYVPAEQIWLPDIVLYNNADGNYEVTIMTKAIIHEDGRVVWNPPAIYKSSCQIDVQYFPFDKQECFMKFGSWTYDGHQVDLKHLNEIPNENIVPMGIDLSEFYLSVEWDIMAVPAMRREKFYSCCEQPYPDITFNITLRRKTLFYTVNLIIPCVGISCLSVLVFYLPSDSGEKVSLSISIMLSLTFFFLVLAEIIPPTSLAMPLLGKYLVFTMILVTVSVLVTIAVLNVHFRSPSTHKMAPWVRKVFIRVLPKILLMRPPQYRIEPESEEAKESSTTRSNGLDVLQAPGPPLPRASFGAGGHPGGLPGAPPEDLVTLPELEASPGEHHFPRDLERAIHNAMFIAQHIDNNDDFESIREDWKYVAMVLDRLFLYIFTIACVVGTAGIFLQAPSLYDQTDPIDVKHSQVARRMMKDYPWTNI